MLELWLLQLVNFGSWLLNYQSEESFKINLIILIIFIIVKMIRKKMF